MPYRFHQTHHATVGAMFKISILEFLTSMGYKTDDGWSPAKPTSRCYWAFLTFLMNDSAHDWPLLSGHDGDQTLMPNANWLNELFGKFTVEITVVHALIVAQVDNTCSLEWMPAPTCVTVVIDNIPVMTTVFWQSFQLTGCFNHAHWIKWALGQFR